MSIYPRNRISESIQQSANRGIAMLIAPAGFGKSEAVIDAYGTGAYWVEITDKGASVETLARLIIEKAAPRSGRALSALLARPLNDENRGHLTQWCASKLRAVEQPIVLEDFQNVGEDPASLKFIRVLIESTVPLVRWVIVSRETPELPIGTWLARDYMTLPLSADDLAFEVSEGSAVATALKVDIDETTLRELVLDVAGWPLALRLSLGSWERTRSLTPLKIRTRLVLFDFIEEQVWSQLSDADRHLFEAAAHLGELRPRILAAAGFPEAQLRLEGLQMRLPLLSRTSNGAFKLHELFKEFVLSKSKRNVDRHRHLIKKIAQALERFGDIDGAIAMYLTAESWEQALAPLARHGIDRMESGHRADVISALAQFPRKFIDHPVITGLRGFSLAMDGAFAVARREIEQALKGDLDDALRGSLSLQIGSLCINSGRPVDAIVILRNLMVNERMNSKTRVMAAAALASASAMAGERELARDAIGFCALTLEANSVEVRALVGHRLAYAHLFLGEAGIAEGYAAESAQLAQSLGLDSIAARAYGVLQVVAQMTYADTVVIRRYSELCLASAIAAGERATQIYALQAQLMIGAYQGDDEFYSSAERGLIELSAEKPSQNTMWLRFAKIIYVAGLGRLPHASSILQSLDLEKLTSAERAFANALSAVINAQHKREAAMVFLSRPILIEAEKDSESQRLLAYARVFHALAQWLIGRGRAARRSPSPDLSTTTVQDAALLNVIVTICSTNRQTTTSLQLAQLTEPLVALQMDGLARFLRQILAPSATTVLTRTELQVLRELRGGGTTADVADRLGRSSHTVLSHLKAACSKIGCSGRAAAVTYASEMGWLD